MESYKPYLVSVVIQVLYAIMHMVSKAAINDAVKTYILIFYRQAFATVFLAPITIFLEWKTAPQLRLNTFVKMFVLSLFGITLSFNLNNLALQYSSAPLAAACNNTIPVMIFFLAVLFRMEKFSLKTTLGISKVAGIALCLGGAATIAVYHGAPYLRLLVHHHLLKIPSLENPDHAPSSTTWVKGVLLMFLAYISWSTWLILQGHLIKIYPSKLICITVQNFLSTTESFIFAISLERDPNEWKLGWNVRLLAAAYCGIMVNGVAFYLQAWVIEKKGSLFQAIWTPLVFILTICFSAVLFGEIISLGSVLGGTLLIIGLYFVLWAKAKEASNEKKNCSSSTDLAQNPHSTSEDKIPVESFPKHSLAENPCSYV